MDEATWRRGVIEREHGRCALHGDRATEAHHRIHGDRADHRAVNGLAVCRLAHDWIEHHFRLAQPLGYTVSRHGVDPGQIPVWMPSGALGRGWYVLDSEFGYQGWPGSVPTQGIPDPDNPQPWEHS